MEKTEELTVGREKRERKKLPQRREKPIVETGEAAPQDDSVRKERRTRKPMPIRVKPLPEQIEDAPEVLDEEVPVETAPEVYEEPAEEAVAAVEDVPEAVDEQAAYVEEEPEAYYEEPEEVAEEAEYEYDEAAEDERDDYYAEDEQEAYYADDEPEVDMEEALAQVKPVQEERPAEQRKPKKKTGSQKHKREKKSGGLGRTGKILIAVFSVIAVFAAAALILFLTSDSNRYWRGMDNLSNPEKAIKYFSKVDNPESPYYCQAKYNMAELLYGEGLYFEAEEAYNEAVASGEWEDYISYSSVALALRFGTRPEALEVNRKRAADLYSLSPESHDRQTAALLYYEMGYYDQARLLFEDVLETSGNPVAEGYLGLMYMNGQGGLDADALKALYHLSNAPDLPEFYVAKGDLALYMGGGSRPAFDKALEYYRLASAAYPGRKDLRYRCEVVGNVMDAEAKYPQTSSRKRKTIYWDSYRWDMGTFTGEVTNVGYGYREAYGWGWFGSDEGSLFIGKLYYQKFFGLGLFFIPSGDSFQVQVGTFADDVLIDGFIIDGGNVQTIENNSSNLVMPQDMR